MFPANEMFISSTMPRCSRDMATIAARIKRGANGTTRKTPSISTVPQSAASQSHGSRIPAASGESSESRP